MTTEGLPRPVVQRKRIRVPWVWVVPVVAILAAAYYLRGHIRDRGPETVVSFIDGSGLRAGETPVTHRGVRVGTVTSVSLSDDHQRALVGVRLTRHNDAFARQGAQYWVVRPQISLENVSGLGTVVSGPYIEATPGPKEAAQADSFEGLEKPPAALGDGIHVEVRTRHVERIQIGSPVYFRGLQVGSVRDTRLSDDATHVRARLFIARRYAALVRTNSRFWTVATADVSGGIFKGLEVRLGSLRNLISGGVAFATPDAPGELVPPDGASFGLATEPQDEWLEWRPQIDIGPETSGPPLP